MKNLYEKTKLEDLVNKVPETRLFLNSKPSNIVLLLERSPSLKGRPYLEGKEQ